MKYNKKGLISIMAVLLIACLTTGMAFADGETLIVTPSEPVAAEGVSAIVVEPTEEVIDIQDEEIPLAVGSGIPMRESADGLSPIVATIPEGAAYETLGVEGRWTKVAYGGTVGYVYGNAQPSVEKKVTIFTSRKSVMAAGETVYLTSVLEGFEGVAELQFQWQYDDGTGFKDMPDATQSEFSFAADATTLGYGWQLIVRFR